MLRSFCFIWTEAKYVYKDYVQLLNRKPWAFFLHSILLPLPMLLLAFLSRQIVEMVNSGSTFSHISKVLGLYTLAFLGITVAINISWHSFWPSFIEYKFIKHRQLGKLLMNIEYSLLESPQIMENFEVARTASSGNSKGFIAFMKNSGATLTALLKFLLSGCMLCYYLPIMLLPVLVVTLYVLRVFLAAHEEIYLNEKRCTELFTRKKEHLDKIILEFKAGKEIRLFALRDLILNKLSGLYDTNLKFCLSNADKKEKLLVKVSACMLVFAMLFYGSLAYCMLSGQLSIALGLMLLLIFNALKSSILTLGVSISGVKKNVQEIADYKAFFTASSGPDRTGVDSRDKVLDTINHIEFKHVWFKYPETANYVLKDVSFALKKGEKLALAGINGGGKTTLLKLLLGFFKATKGEILINGINVNEVKLTSLYERLGPMVQTTNIYAFSAGENIAFQETYSSQKVREALDFAHILDKIEESPEGLDQPMLRTISDTGLVLSGGEAQKVAFARAVYRAQDLCFFDEPAAFLDPFAEEIMLKQIAGACVDKMCIYISHRFTTVQFCDKVLLLKEGRIGEYGTLEEVMAKKGEFYRIYEAQKELYA